MKPNLLKSLLRRLWGLLPWLVVFCLVWLVGDNFAQIKIQQAEIEAETKAALAAEKPLVNVVTLTLAPGPIRETISFPGVIEPWVELNIPVEARGTVTQKLISDGARVKKGAPICRIDSRDYQNAYNSVQASYKTAISSLKRQEKLFSEKLTTRASLDDITARVENLKAELENAALALERCTVRSPMTGSINRVLVERGQYVNPGDTVAEILRLDPVKVIVGVPESDVTAARRQSIFPVTIDALSGEVFSGRVHFLSKKTETTARLFEMEIKIDNPRGRLLPGMFARVEIVKGAVENGLAVPLYAVITRNKETFVYVETDGAAYKRPIRIGVQEGWMVEVSEGLRPDERVIVVGHRGVHDDQKINVVRNVTDPKEILL
ncbi:MAG: efflux RND transporter periplasmic adaptor subunit [Desulfobacterales bacterium]|nr:efflux RND transporter periplasmic adaptor subunit [Desulfobacterales bacterium]